ncbi:hypothetical protein [Paenibacillus germinis]|uniref:hypothetical protein n=1 Tax=Paenibacillus germinis TaxID=2654979 RepID=UPI001FEAFA35|nr:hypothetical protein [Paenibacillus germinis]
MKTHLFRGKVAGSPFYRLKEGAFNRTDQTDLDDKEFIRANLMGPRSIIMVEELTENLSLKKGMRVLFRLWHWTYLYLFSAKIWRNRFCYRSMDQCYNDYARENLELLRADDGKYMNFVSIIASKKKSKEI